MTHDAPHSTNQPDHPLHIAGDQPLPPQVPNSAEQWLTTLLLASLVAVFLMVGSGCRHFLRE